MSEPKLYQNTPIWREIDALRRQSVALDEEAWNLACRALLRAPDGPGLETIDLSRTELDPDVAELLTEELAWELRSIPVRRDGNRVDVVSYHPAYHELMTTAVGHGLHAGIDGQLEILAGLRVPRHGGCESTLLNIPREMHLARMAL